MGPEQSRMHVRRAANGPISRWVCTCQDPPVLLATYDGAGTINIKSRDRYWTVRGEVWARCPLCGTEHYFDRAGLADEAVGA